MPRAKPGRKCRGKFKGRQCRHVVLCGAQGNGFCLLVHNEQRRGSKKTGGGKKKSGG